MELYCICLASRLHNNDDDNGNELCNVITNKELIAIDITKLYTVDLSVFLKHLPLSDAWIKQTTTSAMQHKFIFFESQKNNLPNEITTNKI